MTYTLTHFKVHIYYALLTSTPPPPRSPLFPYTTLFRSAVHPHACHHRSERNRGDERAEQEPAGYDELRQVAGRSSSRSEEHTSELQSRSDLVCRLLLEKKKIHTKPLLDSTFYII